MPSKRDGKNAAAEPPEAKKRNGKRAEYCQGGNRV